MRYLHTMIRVLDLESALRFFCDGLGMQEVRRKDVESGRFTLVFLSIKMLMRHLLQPQQHFEQH